MGKWIWIQHPEPIRNFYLYARKTLSLPSKPGKATLKATADSKYKLYVNGHYVGKGPVRSGSGYVYYDNHDISSFLNKGENVIALLVHHIGESTYSYAPARPGLLCKAEIELEEETLAVTTDETWKVRRAADWTDCGARMSSKLGFQEVYDAGQRIDDWNQVKCSEKGWQDAIVAGRPPSRPWGNLEPRAIPALREETVLPAAVVGAYDSPEVSRDVPAADIPDLMSAAQLTPLKAGSVKGAEALTSTEGVTHIKTPKGDKGVVVLLDFGREVFGNVELGIAGSGSGCIDIGYAELLDDGRVKPNRGDVKYTDRVLLKNGRLRWQGFEPRGFRYMQLEFRRCSRPAALEHVRVNQTTYPVQPGATFECSDRLLNDIWRVGAYTTQLCMEDTFIDCPWRERAQWWGDARIESRAAYYAFDDVSLLAQGLRQLASSQHKDGMISAMYPAGEEKLVPDFALLWVFSILDYYAFADDAALVRDLYPNVRRLLGWFERYTDQYGLLADVPGWAFIDWADLDKRGEQTSLNCLYYQGLKVAGVIANIAGRQEEAAQYAETASRLRLAINKYLYSPKRGLYAECRVDGKIVEKYSRQTNTFAALFDVPDHYQKSTIYRQLLETSLPEITTPYFTSYLLEALYAGDRHEEALNIIRRKWGDMIKAGATTFWEHFTQEASLCHGWSSCPTRDLLAEYVGIKPALGAHRFSVAPHTAGLRWAKGSISTRTGRLNVDWRTSRNSLTIEVEVPEGLRVDVYAPAAGDVTKVTVDGKPWPSRFVTLGSGPHRIRVTAGRLPKPAALDESLKPKPMPHVQVLEDISPRGRGRRAAAPAKRRTRSKRAGKTAEAPKGPAEGESLREPGELEPQLEEQVPMPHTQEQPGAQIAGEGAIEKSKTTRRKPRRRGGRGRSRSSSSPEENATQRPDPASQHERADAEPAAEIPAADTPDAQADQPRPEEQTAQKPKTRRRTSPRRGNRRRSASKKPSKDEDAQAS